MDLSQAIALAEYNALANHRILSKITHLPSIILTTKMSLSYKTILGNIVHILDAQWNWREGAQTGVLPVKPLSLADFDSFSSIKRRWILENHLLLTYVQGLTDEILKGNVTYSWPRARPRNHSL